MRDDLYTPSGGLHTDQRIPNKVRRRGPRPMHKRRLCRDDRNYVFVPFTIPQPLVVGKTTPMERVDRHYWVARIMANAGTHDDGDHPDDGTPSGQPIIAQMHRVTGDLSSDVGILASDSRLKIAEDHHQDVINDDEEGGPVEGDFNILRLEEGEHIYPEILQIGSGRPGGAVVITIVLVPIP